MAKKNAGNYSASSNPFSTPSSTTDDDITATADAHSALDVETIGENVDDDISPAGLMASSMANDDLAAQNNTMESNQGMGTSSSEFNPVGSSSVGVGGDNPFDTTTTPAAIVAPPVSPALPSPSDVTSAAKDAAGAAKDKVADAAGQAKAAAGQAADQVKAQASEAFSQTKETATQAIGRAKENVVSQLETQKGRATDSLGGLTEALRQTGEQFKTQNVPFVPDYAEQFAGQLDRVSDYLKQNNVDQLAHDAEAFARRNPALFIGGAFLLGIGVARFIKASGSASASSISGSYNPDNLPARLDDVSPASGLGYTGPTPTERQDINNDDGIPSGRVMSAHGYVPGGIAGSGSSS